MIRKLTHLWRSLETVPGLCTVPAWWEDGCPEDYALIRPHLHSTDDCGATYPCPNAQDGDCPRNIVDYGDGTYAAICRHPLRLCGDVPLSTSDVVVRQLDLAGLLRKCLELLGIRPQELRNSAAGVWELGLSISQATRGQPTYLLVFSNGSAFRSACRDLFFANRSPFFVIAPTSAHVTVELHQELARRQCTLITLEDRVGLSADGRFVALELTGANEIPPTQVDQRANVVAAYQRKYECTVKSIHDGVNVNRSDFYKWKKGLLKDSSDKARRIEETLRVPPPQRV